MSIPLSLKAEEKSTYAIEDIQFLDKTGAQVLPNEDPAWSLCKEDGTPVASGTLPAGLTADLVLSGDQLAVSSDELIKYNLVLGAKVYYVIRTVSITGIVTTDLGANKPVTQEFIFLIDNITCIT